MEEQGIYLLKNWFEAPVGGTSLLDIWSIIKTVSIHHYLIVSAIIFTIGIFGVIVRRNAISILMCIELMLNSVNLNFVAFNQIWGYKITRAAFTSNEDVLSPVGQVFTAFIIIIAAAEAAVGLAIILALYRQRQSVMVEDANLMRW
jgi:NADH:ubiquinone oxidoreductase subunit K